MLHYFLPAVIVLLVSGAAFSQQDIEKEKDLLKKTDSEFSKLSEEKGANAAFIAYASEGAVMLRANGYPIEGRAAVVETLSRRNDSTFTLVWKPSFADVASSGDLGYTYGTYELKSRPEGKLIGEGTYVTIWKKDKDGNWKFALDAGNEGLKPKKETKK